MSGFAGVVNLDGAPVDQVLVERFEAFLHSRGPDGQGQWVAGNVGLVHTLFATTRESLGERQPMTLDGQSWIVADARMDAREDLIRELAARGCDCSIERPDAELILHAYAVWGEACVEHLLGDFAFAIWDACERKLFCSRDHFGVRPFFYAHEGDTLIFSNAIDAPRLHPDIPDDLYEPAIADYLVVGTGFDLDRTARKAVRRLAPAHVLVASGDQVHTRRYWTLPVDSPTVFRRSRDYVDRFLELFERAVADRLRTDSVGLLMSGGMDSSSVAAMAGRVAGKHGGYCALSAHTQSYRSLIPYEEAHFASLAAGKIGIPWSEFLLDDKQLLGFWDQPEFRRAEPWRVPLFDWTLADVLGKPRHARVVLTGQGSDGVFSSLRGRHCRDRLRESSWLLLAQEVTRHLLSEGRMRRLYLFGHLREVFRERVPLLAYPDWLNPDFERRWQLRERYEQYGGVPVWDPAPDGAVRPEAHRLMAAPIWAGLFETYDPDNVLACLEARHPFFDLRLVRYVLSLPALPWCSDKELLRHSMRGMLPDEVRLRRKQPIVTDLLMAFYRHSRKPWLERFESVEGLSRYVDVKRAMKAVQNPAPWQVTVHLRPISLNYWLHWESQYAYKLPKKEEFRAHTH
jgi:asparagine synthase (glutamine-hydrolysing)